LDKDPLANSDQWVLKSTCPNQGSTCSGKHASLKVTPCDYDSSDGEEDADVNCDCHIDAHVFERIQLTIYFPFPPLLFICMYYLHTLVAIGFYNCGRFKEIRPDLLSNGRKS
jgi:hypothetical protein